MDLSSLLSKVPYCNDLVTTGEKAASVIASLTNTELPKVGEFRVCKIPMITGEVREFKHWRMPSTSRAYPMKLEKKMEYYKSMLTEVGVIKGPGCNVV